MGCVASRIEKVERVQVCKQRKKAMKQLVGFRGDFVEAQLAYLKALKNTGVTLRQFTESESLDFDSVSVSAAETFAPPPPPPASPPMDLPPAPPPPPPLSPDPRKTTDEDTRKEREEEEEEEEGEIEECVSPPMPGSAWAPWDPFPSEEAEDWAETKTEFEGEEEQEEEGKGVEKSEAVSEKAKRMVVMWRGEGIRRRRKESLESVVKELDDHFLRASAGVKEITVIMDLNGSHRLLPHGLNHENAGKKGNTAKVFSALSWSWSSKSLSRDSVDSGAGISEPCRPGAHCVTLKKFLEEEQKLYKDVKEEEIVKQEHERKSSLLQKQDNENHDSTKIEKIRSSVENLEADLMRLRESISRTCLSILNRVDDELYPQIVAITSGLLQMWKTMQESHEAQYKISQLLNHLSDDQKMDPSTAYHRQAAVELKAEVNRWYNSFCQVASSQKDYVRTLSRWLRLTDGLKEDGRHSLHSAAVARLCDKWLSSLERLPDKAASEAIKSLCSAVQAIVVQQEEENSLQRKYEKAERRLHRELESQTEMERRLHRELESQTEMEMKLEGTSGDVSSGLSPKHPLVLKRAKAEALKRLLEAEKATYFKSVQATKALTLNSLRTSLPCVFKALADFSRGSVEAIEALFSRVKPEEEDNPETPHTE